MSEAPPLSSNELNSFFTEDEHGRSQCVYLASDVDAAVEQLTRERDQIRNMLDRSAPFLANIEAASALHKEILDYRFPETTLSGEPHSAPEMPTTAASKPNYTVDPYDNPLPDLQPAPASNEHTGEEYFGMDRSELRAVVVERDKGIERLTKALRIAEIKASGTLANNLCPDHRDKQTGKPCLACEIERLDRANTGLATESERFTRERDAARKSAREDEDQLCRIANAFGMDARNAPEHDLTVAGAVIAERDRLRALLREAARQIRSDSGPCPVDLTSRVGLLLTRIDLQLKDSSDETSGESNG